MSERPRRTRWGLWLLNLPWLVLWWYYSGPDSPRAWSVPALFLLLTLAVVGMVILPLCLGRLPRKRWLLVALLGVTNIYWALRWIEAFALARPGDPDYPTARLAFPALMVISTLVVILGYRLVDHLLARHDRTSQSPGKPL